MKHFSLILIFLLVSHYCLAQASSGSFTVQGDFDKFYPVTWNDPAWGSNVATELQIGRSDVHTNSSWRGSIIAKFRYHINAWGNGSNFIDADIRYSQNAFVAGWRDASGAGSTGDVVIWLRGGGTSYYYTANYPIVLTIYDGVQNPLPFQEGNGPADSYKTGIDSYVNSNGLSYSGNAYFNANAYVGPINQGGLGDNFQVGTGGQYFRVFPSGIGVTDAGWRNTLVLSNNYTYHEIYNNSGFPLVFQNTNGGNVLIGKTSQTNTSYRLDVNGNMRANEVVVNTTGADFVFDSTYQLPPLSRVEDYIRQNKHLSEVPSSKEMRTNGVNLGENQMKLLQKVEELTLYVIAQNKKIQILKKQVEELKQK